MNEEAREHAMELLAAMMVADKAEKEKKSQEEVWREFRKSLTYRNLFEPETGLWMNGPDYISEEYDEELKRKTVISDTFEKQDI